MKLYLELDFWAAQCEVMLEQLLGNFVFGVGKSTLTRRYMDQILKMDHRSTEYFSLENEEILKIFSYCVYT